MGDTHPLFLLQFQVSLLNARFFHRFSTTVCRLDRSFQKVLYHHSPVAHFQRRPGGSPEPKATLTGTRQSQNGKDAQRFDVFIQEKYNNVTIQSQVIGRFKSGRK